MKAVSKSKFCNFVRSKVYSNPLPANLNQLEMNLLREMMALPPDMITRALGDMKKRARLCLANNALWVKAFWRGVNSILERCNSFNQ